MEAWLESRISYELLANYTLLRRPGRRAQPSEVAEHFQQASGEVLGRLSVFNPTTQLTGTAGRAQDRTGRG